jgi:hypothetical protein
MAPETVTPELIAAPIARRLFGRAEQHSNQATAQAFADAVSHAFIAGVGFATLAQVVIIFVPPQETTSTVGDAPAAHADA